MGIQNRFKASPSVPYSENPYVDVVEFSNLSTGGKNIFGVIFDNVSGVSGQSYSANYNGETWTFKDDITYLIEDTNQNSTLDSSDVILREVNWNGVYSDFGGLLARVEF